MTDNTDVGKARKPKSPAVPSRTLKAALEDVEKIYKQYTHSTFSRAEIASQLGVSASSGPFGSRIYSLREYGLIEGAGGSYKVSQVFMDLHSADPQSAQFKRRALEAIRRSKVFDELLAEWSQKLPTQDAVAQRLESQKQFNPDRAKEAAAVLEESLKYIGILDASNNILPIRDEHPGGNRNPGGQSRSEPGATGQTDAPGDLPTPNNLRTEVPLSKGRAAIVLYPTDLTSAEAAKIGNVLKAIVG